MIYELINPSDKIFLIAPNEKIASFSAWCCSDMYGVEDENGESFGILRFGGKELIKSMFGDMDIFLKENVEEIVKCLNSFYLEKERSSMNDIVSYAKKVAKRLKPE